MQLNNVLTVQLDELNAMAREALGDDPAPREPRVELAKITTHIRVRTDLCAYGNHRGCIGGGYISPNRIVRCECDCHG